MTNKKSNHLIKNKKNKGFSLVELLIALLISLLIVLACTTLYGSLKNSIMLAQRLSIAQESLRGSFHLMSRSIRQAESFTIASGSTQLITTYGTPPTGTQIYSCLGNSVSASTDTYRSDGDYLYCDDGSGEKKIALSVTELKFETITGTSTDGVKVTIKIDGLPASFSDGISFTLALRQRILLDLAN